MSETELILVGYVGALLSVLFVSILLRLDGWRMYRWRSVEQTEKVMEMWRDKYFAAMGVKDEDQIDG